MTSNRVDVGLGAVNSRKRPAPTQEQEDLPTALLQRMPSIEDPSRTSSTPSSALQRIIKTNNSKRNHIPSGSDGAVQTGMPRNVMSASMARNVPAFLNKLYNMVTDPSTDGLIQWGPDGTTFIVQRHEDFARDVLPRFFKHNNFASFVRQLNMYGFHKIPHLQQGVLHSDGEPEMWEFSNPNFQRNQPDLLCLVSRKKGRDGGEDKDNNNQQHQNQATMDVNYIIQEIAAIKRHQLTISSDLKSIQRENQVLWSESVAVRDRYQRQQETIDKILRFLASIFSNKKPLMSKKRRLLLDRVPGAPAINDDDGEEDVGEDDDDDDALDSGNISQRIQDLIQSPPLNISSPEAGSLSSMFPNTQKLLAPSILSASSPPPNATDYGETSQAAVPLPYYEQPLLTDDPNYQVAVQATNNVADDIDLLQDHLHDISQLVGLDPSSLDDLGAYDMGDLLGPQNEHSSSSSSTAPALDGSEEDRRTLIALMKQFPSVFHPPPEQQEQYSGYQDSPLSSANNNSNSNDSILRSNAGQYQSVPLQSQSSTPSDLTDMTRIPQFLSNQNVPSASSALSAPARVRRTSNNPQSGSGQNIINTGNNINFQQQQLQQQPQRQQQLPQVNIDDLQNQLLTTENYDDLANIVIPDNMDPSDFDFLDDPPS